MTFRDDTLEKWERWCERIHAEVHDLYLNRHIFRRVRELGTGHPLFRAKLSLPYNVYWHFLHATYIHYAAAAVRRQSKSGRQSISLRRLLLQLADHPHFVSREEFLAAEAVGDATPEQASAFFDRFAPAGARHLDTMFILDDAASLELAAREITTFADRAVAHLDKRGVAAVPDLSMIDEPIDKIGELFVAYSRLVVHQRYDLGAPASVEPNLRLLFSSPWTTMPE